MSEHLCPLTHRAIKETARVPSSSICFERAALERWIMRHATNPVTLQTMTKEEILAEPSNQNKSDDNIEKSSVCRFDQDVSFCLMAEIMIA